jgi:hypothetical protein
MRNIYLYLNFFFFCLFFVQISFSQNHLDKKPIILLRSSWQTINIGDVGHTPGVLALIEKQLPGVEVKLWASKVDNGVREMLLRRFPKLDIILPTDTLKLNKAFEECSFLLHGSGPWLVADQDVKKWVIKTGKPYGVFGITLPEDKATPEVVTLLSNAKFVYFRDTVSLELAKRLGVRSPIVQFGPDGAFAVDLRNESAALKFLKDNSLETGKFICVIPKYRRTPKWKIPSDNVPFDSAIHAFNESMKEHDLLPYRNAIIDLVRRSKVKVLVCPEDVTQVALGKEMLYDPLPDDVKKDVVWRSSYWLTDEALSVYTRSIGLFGLEQHSPIMCIANGIPALVGRFKEQTSKGYMWYNIGLKDWFFDSDDEKKMEKLSRTIRSFVSHPDKTKRKVNAAQSIVIRSQQEMIQQLEKVLY